MKNKNFYNKQMRIITGKNVNVPNTNDAQDFFIFLTGFICILLVFIFSFSFFINIVIDNISAESQVKIEKLFYEDVNTYIPPKYEKKIEYLEYQKNRIIQLDKKLQNKSSFPIEVVESKKVNAMISPSGIIYINTGILDGYFTNEELTFVLAHELGHYAHRDHLKTMGRKLAIPLFYIITGQNSSFQNEIINISKIGLLKYSREQEKQADLYAGEILFKLYGTNQAGKGFISKIGVNDKENDFSEYFSTHPTCKNRLRYLETQDII